MPECLAPQPSAAHPLEAARTVPPGDIRRLVIVTDAWHPR
jgi:hypothetical protein